MTVFDERAAHDRARRFIAPGVPAGFLEGMSASFDAMRRANTSVALEVNLADVYEREVERIFAATGKRLPNPVHEVDIFGGDEEAGKILRAAAKRRQQAGRRAVPGGLDLAARERAFRDLAAEAGAELPDPGEIHERALALARTAEETAADVGGRLQGLDNVATLIGGMGGAASDPPVFLSMFAGAPAAAGILRTAATEAAIGGVTEAAIQPRVQAYRKKAGLEAGIEQALTNIAFAFGGGAILGGGARAIGRGIEHLTARKPATPAERGERDARAFAERLRTLADANPYLDTRPGRSFHAQRLTEAQEWLATGAPAHPVDGPALRPGARRASPDPAVRQAIDEPELRAAYDAGLSLRDRALQDIGGRENLKLAKAVIDEMDRAGADPRDLAAFLRNPPEKPRVKGLTQFLMEAGGVREAGGELAHIGITGRTRPGLVNNRTGRTFDEAGEAAFEAGFFRRRPTEAELLAALEGDFKGAARRLVDDDEVAMREFESLEADFLDVERTFANLGLDARTMDEAEILERLRVLRETPLPGEAFMKGVNEAMTSAKASRESEAAMAELDAVLEAEVRRDWQADMGRDVWLAGDTGRPANDQVFQSTAREVFEDLDGDAALMREWDACLAATFGEAVT